MGPNIGRRDMAPRLLRGRHDDGLERDWDGHVVGLRRHVGEDHRHGVFPRVTALEPRGIVRGVRVRGVRVRHRGVPVRRGTVVVVGVIVVAAAGMLLTSAGERVRRHFQRWRPEHVGGR